VVQLRTPRRENGIREVGQCFAPVHSPVGKSSDKVNESATSTGYIKFTCRVHQEGYDEDGPSSVLLRQRAPQERSNTVPSDK
jgi:hypothetical protein